ncbi:MAG: hypothetical protein ACLRHW_08530, partial [Coprobacillus cateniformis]
LIIDANHTMKTHYTVKTYSIIDNSTGKPITMNIGDTLIVYYQLKVAKDNLPMVYVMKIKIYQLQMTSTLLISHVLENIIR